MQVTNLRWDGEWRPSLPSVAADADSPHTLVLAFADTDVPLEALTQLSVALPSSTVVGCSTAGQIADGQIMPDPAVAAVVRFTHVRPRVAATALRDGESSADLGRRLGAQVVAAGEPGSETVGRNVLVFSDGLQINGSDLVSGLLDSLPAGSRISGGLAGDGPDFVTTWIYAEGERREGVVAAVDLGASARVTHGSSSGWVPFGPLRRITESSGNVLRTLDGGPILALYREYLGQLADELPGSALMFPLAIYAPDGTLRYVRTVLSVDDEAQTVTFAGDVPEGWSARLMRASVAGLVAAAKAAGEQGAQAGDTVSLAVSCVGRRLMLGERAEDEIEAMQQAVDGHVIGFYSYGEITPVDGVSGLHNQTMTVTTISETDL